MTQKRFSFTWDDVPLLESAPPGELPEGNTFPADSSRYWECGATGFDMMTAWMMGSRTLRRYPDSRVPMAEHIVTNENGVHTFSQPIDDEFAAEIEDALNDYLQASGLPRRPAGFRWFQAIPNEVEPADILDAAIEAQMAAGRSPIRQAEKVRGALHHLLKLRPNGG